MTRPDSAGLRKALTLVGVTCGCLEAFALSWKGLERIPAEAVEGSGLGKAELERRLDKIAAANVGKPFVVTKTAWMVELFDKARLSVKPEDRFVDIFPEWYVYTDRRDRAVGKFMAAHSSPVRAVATPWFDTSHTCPDWAAVLALGPKGLADRARKRRASATKLLRWDSSAETFSSTRFRIPRSAPCGKGPPHLNGPNL